MQDVRRVGEQVRPQVLADVGLGQLGEVLGELRRRVPPREVAVRLREAALARWRITFGRVNASDRKIVSGWSRLISASAQCPEPERLGVRVVDAEDRHAVADPELEDVLQLRPQRLPGRPTRS